MTQVDVVNKKAEIASVILLNEIEKDLMDPQPDTSKSTQSYKWIDMLVSLSRSILNDPLLCFDFWLEEKEYVPHCNKCLCTVVGPEFCLSNFKVYAEDIVHVPHINLDVKLNGNKGVSQVG